MFNHLKSFFRARLFSKYQIPADKVLSAIDEPAFLVGLDDRIIFCNSAGLTIFGLFDQDITNRTFQDVLLSHPGFISEENLLIEDGLQRGGTANTKDGTTYKITSRLVLDESNRPAGKVILMQKISRLPTHQTESSQSSGAVKSGNNRLRRDPGESRIPSDQKPSQLAILNEIGEGIATSIEENTVILRAVHLVQSYFGYYNVSFFSPDEQQTALVIRYTSGAYAKIIPETLSYKPGQGMVGWVAENKSYLLANNVLIEPNYHSVNPEIMPTRSELTLPILANDKIVGVLDIQSPDLDAFSDDDVSMLKMIAGQIAVALENARLYEELKLQLKERERRENILRIQRDLLVQISTATTLKETLQTTLDMVATELHASRAVISLVERESQNLYLGASFHVKDQPALLPPLVNPTIAEWVAKNALPMLVQSTQSLVTGFPPGTPNILYIPLSLSKKVIGVITLESGEGRKFSQEDMQAVNNLPNSLVMLIERARLFEEVQNARAELEARAAELEEANANLRELDRLKSQFLANISHELRTPLNSIIGFTEVMIDELPGPLNDKQMEYSQDILDSGRHLLALINNLLDFSQATADKLNLRISTFEVEKLFSELRDSMAPLIARKSQNLVFSQKSELPLLSADYLRIKQVFYNLISNANKFTSNYGSIQVSCTQTQDDQLLFEISDTGIGIHPKDQEIIFEEFRQVDGSLTREVPGTGLGLSISRRIIDLHHGKLWVKSELGKGSTFFIQLPVKTDLRVESHPNDDCEIANCI